MAGAWNAAVQADIDAIDEPGIAGGQLLERFGAAAGKARFLPDFVKPARIATVPREDVLARNPQPAGEPDVNCVR